MIYHFCCIHFIAPLHMGTMQRQSVKGCLLNIIHSNMTYINTTSMDVRKKISWKNHIHTGIFDDLRWPLLNILYIVLYVVLHIASYIELYCTLHQTSNHITHIKITPLMTAAGCILYASKAAICIICNSCNTCPFARGMKLVTCDAQPWLQLHT